MRQRCLEDERIVGAEEFIKTIEPRLKKVVLPPVGEGGYPPVVIFGGHCYGTFYKVGEGRDGRLIFDKAKPGEKGYEYGDGRLAVWSAGWERPINHGGGGYNFFLCEDHLGLVKNPSFRYNLLRELVVVRAWLLQE